jgi:hypothetical protein
MKSGVKRARIALLCFVFLLLTGLVPVSYTLASKAEAQCCPGLILIISDRGYACLHDCIHGWACCNDP